MEINKKLDKILDNIKTMELRLGNLEAKLHQTTADVTYNKNTIADLAQAAEMTYHRCQELTKMKHRADPKPWKIDVGRSHRRSRKQNQTKQH